MNNNKLPIVISVPHAGCSVPDSLKELSLLTEDQIKQDGDEGAVEIYNIFSDNVNFYYQSSIARAFVDLNRAPDDFSLDGVIKTHTCQMIPIYNKPLSDIHIQKLLKEIYYPWHAKLKNVSSIKTMLFGVDCHTMAEKAPSIRENAGRERPYVCLSNAGSTCPDEWLILMKELFEDYFGAGTVSINTPFNGGYIIKHHSKNLHWIQLELSRAPFTSNITKSQVVFTVIKQLFDYVSNEEKYKVI